MGRYGITEVFDTIQGEGARSGTRAVFVRFSGCNLWTGNPLHRKDDDNGPCALWCDTDFRKGNVVSAEELLATMEELWPLPHQLDERWCVLTGGEPLLQVDDELVRALHNANWNIAVETNGTVPNEAAKRADHICLSPKRGTNWRAFGAAHEVKVVLPGAAIFDERGGWTDDELDDIAKWARGLDPVEPIELYIQPQDPVVALDHVADTHLHRQSEVVESEDHWLQESWAANVKRCVDFIKSRRPWRLSPQTHKFLGLP